MLEDAGFEAVVAEDRTDQVFTDYFSVSGDNLCWLVDVATPIHVAYWRTPIHVLKDEFWCCAVCECSQERARCY